MKIIHWKLCKISFLRKLVSKKLISECNVWNMELPSWFSESWWHILFQMKRVSKWLLRLYYVLIIIGKLCRWILLMKIESYIWSMIEPKCYWVSCKKRWICNERFQNWITFSCFFIAVSVADGGCIPFLLILHVEQGCLLGFFALIVVVTARGGFCC